MTLLSGLEQLSCRQRASYTITELGRSRKEAIDWMGLIQILSIRFRLQSFNAKMNNFKSILARICFLLAFRFNTVSGQCSQEQIDVLDYIGNYLEVRYAVLRNYDSNDQVSWSQVDLTNSGQQDISAGGPVQWSVYLSLLRGIQDTLGTKNESEIPNSGLKVRHINGCLHRLSPTSSFATLLPGQTLTVTFNVTHGMISHTDVFPNWYVAADGCTESRTILSTAKEANFFTAPFDTADKWKRSWNDLYDPYTPSVRYNGSYVRDIGADSVLTRILPTPLEADLDAGNTVNIKYGGWVIVEPVSELKQEAEFLSDALGLTVVPEASAPSSRRIFLLIGSVSNPNGTKELASAEAYQLEIDAADGGETVTLTGPTGAGVFRGIQSVLSLTDHSDNVPSGVVRDGPRFEYRGMHVDVSRNFHQVEEIFRLMDAMTVYKMNQLHLHLTDDEGWRLEIPEIPELTQVGSRRCHDPTGDQCIIPQLGSNPTLSNTGTGYYSVATYRSILAYAVKRHIRVIPEVDMPGHSHAAIHSMLARYRKYISTNATAATQYLLSDFDDRSEYLSAQYFTDGAVNPCMESTYSFIDTVVGSVKALHADIQPLTVFHLGGDEVASTAWIGSPICQQLNLSRPDLYLRFVTTASQIVEAHGLEMVMWDDGVYYNGLPIDMTLLGGDNVYATVWSNVWEWGNGKRAYELANNDYKVVISHATHLYIDHPSEPDPEERGLYWATRFTSPFKLFAFMPDSLYDNIGVDGNGSPLDKDAVCSAFGCPPLQDEQSRANVIGMQGQLWSEVTRFPENLTYMIFPRIVVLAERAWHRAEFESVEDEIARNETLKGEWETFANILGHKEFKRLDRLGIRYNIAPAGAVIDPDNHYNIFVTSGYPGLPVVYSLDEGLTWISCESVINLPPDTTFPIDVQLRVLSADRSRSSRQISLTVNDPGRKTSASRRDALHGN